MRIKGISKEYSELLQAAGVDTVKELKYRNPANLAKAMADANKKAQAGAPAAVGEGGGALDRQRQEAAAEDHVLTRCAGARPARQLPSKAGSASLDSGWPAAQSQPMALADTLENRSQTAAKSAPDALSALLALGRPLVMGILNVTPDSFSDGGRFLDPATAIAHAPRHGRAGRRYPRHRRGIRPGPMAARQPVSAEEERARLAPRAAGGGQARPAGVDRHHQGARSPPGRSIRARPSSTTSGACSAIPTWRRWWPRAACR